MMTAPTTASEETCPLCSGLQTRVVHEQCIGGAEPIRRSFSQCLTCDLVFVPPRFHLSREQERAVYDQHQNHHEDLHYRAFLSRLVAPLHARLSAGAHGLDFGCGPGPTLSTMMRELGTPCEDYDPFFFSDASLLERTYDYIASTEVFEHVSAPGAIIQKLQGMLIPGGWLGVMTKRLSSIDALASWHYIRDPTHVCFFGDATFAWIGQRYGFDVHLMSPDVVLLQRNTRTPAINSSR